MGSKEITEVLSVLGVLVKQLHLRSLNREILNDDIFFGELFIFIGTMRSSMRN